jgi:hypothetical protein
VLRTRDPVHGLGIGCSGMRDPIPSLVKALCASDYSTVVLVPHP